MAAKPERSTASRGAVSSPVRGRVLVSAAVVVPVVLVVVPDAGVVVAPSADVEFGAGCDMLSLLESGV
jgi:hypothetical protein